MGWDSPKSSALSSQAELLCSPAGWRLRLVGEETQVFSLTESRTMGSQPAAQSLRPCFRFRSEPAVAPWEGTRSIV